MKNLKTDKANLLLIGIGNTGRSDDGVGWRFVDFILNAGVAEVDCEFRYQLQVEDALLISRYDKVIFIDASHAEWDNGFILEHCIPAQHYYFSSHIQIPETILYLAKELYNKSPEAYTLAITGKRWEMGTTVSEEAEKNLQRAIEFFGKNFILPFYQAGKSYASGTFHNTVHTI